jgi:dienelactone hydrolase
MIGKLSLVVFAFTASLLAQTPPATTPQASPLYATIFYKSGPLRIEGYLYKPAGNGPFPLIVYNHGSREGQDRAENPFPFIGRLLTTAGYAVLVPERRGYGKSDGTTFREEVGADTAGRFLNRLHAETDDVRAALEFVKGDPDLDTSRTAILGWSLGGIISVFAASQAGAFFAIVDQAGGALTWPRSPALQSALRDAGRNVQAPILCLDAENDATTAAAKTVCDAAKARGVSAELKIYPPFTPAQNANNVAPGHLIFSGQGVSIWGRDVLAFLNSHRP